ncbi:MAG: ribose-phosphate diphosphokinase [Myxacorys californica WJT36-NPBG1]|jgi:ribose-phosphate pyrophosphokinase|nr:ribose-phosphate diphosphokinase [Myxacorys californica WJT36-NPBG1]
MQIVATETAMPLANAVVRELRGAAATKLQTQTFSNGQIEVRFTGSHTDVVLFQVFADCVHDRLFELLLALDLLRAAGAQRLTAVLPHLPYSRSDRPAATGAPVPARLLASLMEHAGLSRLVTVEMHAPQISGFFRCPVTNIDFVPALARHLSDVPPENLVVVSPDLGGAKRAERLAIALRCPVAVLRKHRENDIRKGVEVLGEVAGRAALLIDDEVNTGQTLLSAADLLKSRGATSVCLAVAHALFTPDAVARLCTSSVERVIVSDSTGSRIFPKNVEIVSIAGDIAACL